MLAALVLAAANLGMLGHGCSGSLGGGHCGTSARLHSSNPDVTYGSSSIMSSPGLVPAFAQATFLPTLPA